MNAAVVVLVCALGAVGVHAEDVTIVGKLGERLDQVVSSRDAGPPWGAVLVEVDGVVVLSRGYGLADGRKHSCTPETVFGLGMIGTVYTSTAVLTLIHEGKLALDDTLGDRFKRLPPAMRGITVRQLLEERSGISGDIPGGHDRWYDMDRYVEKLAEHPLSSTPGTTTEASRDSWRMLAALVSKKVRKEPGAWIRKYALRPLDADLDHTWVSDERVKAGKLESRHSGDGAVDIGVDELLRGSWASYGPRGIIASSTDVHAFVSAIRSPTFLDDELRAMVFPTKLDERRGGWLLSEREADSVRMLTAGDAEGNARWSSRIVILPDHKATVVVLTAGKDMLDQVCDGLVDVVVEMP